MNKGHVAIVGSGLIGSTWAVMFARFGYTVQVYDAIQSQLGQCEKAVDALLNRLQRESLLQGQDVSTVRCRISMQEDLKIALRGSFWVQECVPENLDIKRSVFRTLDENCDDGTILASSTSNLTPDQFTHDLKHRARCVVCHPVNPPFAIPVVEVVPAPWTEKSTIEMAVATLKDIGQSPVVLNKSVDGFLVNRLQYALLMEAFRLVQDGVASPQDIDTAISQGLGTRWSFMGPFETIDLNAPQGVTDYCARYMGGIERVVATQDNQVKITQDTIDTVAAAMKQQVPDDKRAARTEWRNARLLALHKHKLDAEKWDNNTK